MTVDEMVNELETLASAAGDWDVTDEHGRRVIGVTLTRKGVEIGVESE